MPMSKRLSSRRVLAALGLVIIASAGHYLGPSIMLGMGLWLLRAIGVGLLLTRWWALVLAAIPWPLGVGAGLITGRYAFLGEFWQIPAAFSMMLGVIGITTGMLLDRVLRRPE